MTAPKISQTTENAKLLGRRDAFHVPSVLVFSNEIIQPRAYVRFTSEKFNEVIPTDLSTRHAVVDPFLARPVKPGTLFWVFLAPEYTSNLVHHYKIDIEIKDEEDDSCAGCYGYDESDECKGCYD